MKDFVNVQLGKYIKDKMAEREYYLRKSGKIKSGKKLSGNYMGKEILGVSGTWFCNVLRGEKFPNDDMLIKIADYLEIDEHEIFKIARRIHPSVLEELKREYLGEYYISQENLSTKDGNNG